MNKHEMSKTKFYKSWGDMKTRCTNPKYNGYKNYGGRGIKFDPIWNDFKKFKEDMYSSYREGLTLDRINNNKGYSKENCRWITKKEQHSNKRTNRLITYKGVTKTISQWAEKYGIPRTRFTTRFYTYKWSFEKCLNYKRRSLA